MQTGILSVQRLFDREVHYAVPLYQRPYVWNEEEQWQPVWTLPVIQVVFRQF